MVFIPRRSGCQGKGRVGGGRQSGHRLGTNVSLVPPQKSAKIPPSPESGDLTKYGKTFLFVILSEVKDL